MLANFTKLLILLKIGTHKCVLDKNIEQIRISLTYEDFFEIA